MYQIAVCDDDRADREAIVQLTRRIMDEAGVPCAVEAYDAGGPLLREIRSGRPFDLLLLDVRMAGLDGMSLASQLMGAPARPDVVFISTDRDMALQGYRVDARRFLAKPVEPGQLREALLHCYREAEERAQRRDDLLLPTAAGEVRVAVRDIRYAESWGRAARISTPSGLMETRLRLGELAARLPEQFIYCHRTILVNLDYVRRLGQGELELRGGGTLPVSRYRAAEVQRLLLEQLKR